MPLPRVSEILRKNCMPAYLGPTVMFCPHFRRFSASASSTAGPCVFARAAAPSAALPRSKCLTIRPLPFELTGWPALRGSSEDPGFGAGQGAEMGLHSSLRHPPISKLLLLVELMVRHVSAQPMAVTHSDACAAASRASEGQQLAGSERQSTTATWTVHISRCCRARPAQLSVLHGSLQSVFGGLGRDLGGGGGGGGGGGARARRV